MQGAAAAAGVAGPSGRCPGDLKGPEVALGAPEGQVGGKLGDLRGHHLGV